MLRAIIVTIAMALVDGIKINEDLKSVTWIGYQGSTAVFSYYHDGYRDLYTFDESNSNFTLLEKNRIQASYPNYYVSYYYVEDNFRRYSVPKTENSFPFAFEFGGDLEIIQIPFNPQGVGYDLKRKTAYLSKHSSNPDLNENLPIYQLNLETGELKELPIKGMHPVVIENYLFYAAYSDPKQFDLVYDINRVKIENWQNPENIFKDNYMNEWNVSDDGKYLLAELIEYGYEPQKVIYCVEENKYALINNEGLPSSVFYSRNKQTFCFYDISLNSSGKRHFVYPKIPLVFPYVPSWAMSFEGTFITTYLLEIAGEAELEKLDKFQLRLLRNAIFARKGWRFQANDLTIFFNQFTWYKDQLSRIASNDEIKLTNRDKYRSQLILKIEQSK